jgi:hypothetical protein
VEERATLFTLAEIAIGMAGFSAIVVMFRRRESGTWDAADADRFNGMVLHAVAAAFFCVLPTILHTLTRDAATTWMLGSALLGLGVTVHAGIILWLPTTAGAQIAIVGGGALFVVGLQLANAAGFGYSREFEPYLVGVLWNIINAGHLFLRLVWVRSSDVRAGPEARHEGGRHE